MASLATSWGPATEAERLHPSPADAFLPRPHERWVRAVRVAAPPDLVWAWLCQLRVAPYSYDTIDNLGRRSPQHRDPALEAVAVGDRALIAFTVAALERPRHLTFLAEPRSPLLPRMAMAYVVEPDGTGCRLIAHLLVSAGPAVKPAALRRALLAALRVGDLVMIRRQLLNLRDLAERDAATA